MRPKALMNRRHRHRTPARRCSSSAPQLPDPARRRARARGGDGARRHGRLRAGRRRRPGCRADLVRRLLRRPGDRVPRLRARRRDIARVDGGPLLSFRLSMRTVVAGFGVFGARTRRAASRSTTGRSGARASAASEAVAACSRSACSSTPSSRRRPRLRGRAPVRDGRTRAARDDLPLARSRAGVPRRTVGHAHRSGSSRLPTRPGGGRIRKWFANVVAGI